MSLARLPVWKFSGPAVLRGRVSPADTVDLDAPLADWTDRSLRGLQPSCNPKRQTAATPARSMSVQAEQRRAVESLLCPPFAPRQPDRQTPTPFAKAVDSYQLSPSTPKLFALLDALMLQGTSPVATLVDFLSIGSGTLSGVRNEEELAEQGGQMTLTGFAQHA